MADTKFSALPVATQVNPADLLCVSQGGISKQATAGLVTKSAYYSNASTAAQTGFATDTYLTGSLITVPTGIWTASTTYRCVWDFSKTAAGVATLTINFRIGTAGSIADTAVLAWTAGVAQTAAADQGRFEALLNVRTIGASATIIAIINVARLLSTAAGLFATTTGNISSQGQSTTTFNSTTATKIGLSINGGASFSGTTQLVQSELCIP